MSTIKIGDIEAIYSNHMGDDLMVVNAARQSFNKQKTVFDNKDVGLINFLATGMRTKEWDNFLDLILGYGEQHARCLGAEESTSIRAGLKEQLLKYKRQAVHWAPFGHPHVTIRARFPIFLARQLVKHQIGGTWSEESRRYIDDEVEYYFEPVLHVRPEDVKQGSGNEHEQSEYILKKMHDLVEFTNAMYQDTVTLKVAPEEAREILTLNSMTGITWTGSLLFWSRVVTQRVDPHAQLAAQKFARQVDAIIRPLYPVSWQALVGSID